MQIITFQRIYIFTIILLILLLTYTIYYVYENKEGLTENPLIYGVNKAFPNGELSCSCVLNDQDRSAFFSFNNTHVWINNYGF